jgi:hypothetical protein
MEMHMPDVFAYHTPGLSAPLATAFAITPNDSTDLPAITRQLRITGAAGNVVVVWMDGTETTEPVQAFETLDWRIRRVKATGTTATGLRGYA